MEVIRFGVGAILPYVAVAVFIAGMSYRVRVWRKAASPAMTLFPAPPTEAANIVNTLKEAALFRSLFKADRALWVSAWLFHVVLALIFVGHLRVFVNADRLLMSLGMGEGDIQALSSGAGGGAGLVVGITALILLFRRLIVQRVREITGTGDCVILLLIGAIVTTGNMMRFSPQHFDLGLTRAYFAGLATFSGVGGMTVLNNNLFMVHLCLAFLLVMVMPFSKLLHFGGIFFTHQLIRRH